MNKTVTAFITDPDLKRFYEGIRNGLEATILIEGQTLLEKSADPVSLLYVMKIAAMDMLQDLEEHGDEHADRYEGITRDEAAALLVTIDAQLRDHAQQGRSAPIWSEFKLNAAAHYKKVGTSLKYALHGLLS